MFARLTRRLLARPANVPSDLEHIRWVQARGMAIMMYHGVRDHPLLFFAGRERLKPGDRHVVAVRGDQIVQTTGIGQRHAVEASPRAAASKRPGSSPGTNSVDSPSGLRSATLVPQRIPRTGHHGGSSVDLSFGSVTDSGNLRPSAGRGAGGPDSSPGPPDGARYAPGLAPGERAARCDRLQLTREVHKPPGCGLCWQLAGAGRRPRRRQTEGPHRKRR